MAASPNVRSAVGDLDMLFLKPDGIGFVFDAADGMPTRVCSIDLARMFGDGMSDAARQLCHLISCCGVSSARRLLQLPRHRVDRPRLTLGRKQTR